MNRNDVTVNEKSIRRPRNLTEAVKYTMLQYKKH